MYIEEVTIDGFKSYAQRVTVPSFDRYFNAITGLNGSGKSNILDSICFVLGISNLSQVSVHSKYEIKAPQCVSGWLDLSHRSEPTACKTLCTSKVRLASPKQLYL